MSITFVAAITSIITIRITSSKASNAASSGSISPQLIALTEELNDEFRMTTQEEFEKIEMIPTKTLPKEALTFRRRMWYG